MGIRFYCPNGHKLNVKTELAGKYGICPQCGVRMEIPLESTRESEKKQPVEDDLRLAENESLSNPDTDQSRLFPTDEPAVSSDQQSDQQLSQTDTSSPAPSGDPSVLDDMNVVWYVQAANGQRFGPATGPIIKTWIQEKRIGPTMLVWREGWPEWLQAKHVFPEVAQLFKPAGGKEKAASPPPIAASKPAPTNPAQKSSSSKPQPVATTPVDINPTKANVQQPMFDLGDFGDLVDETAGLESESTGLGLRSKKKTIENFGLIVGFLVIMAVMLIILAAVLYINTRPREKKKPQIRVNVVSFESVSDSSFPMA